MSKRLYGLATLNERFERRYTPEPNTGCWLWTGQLTRDGYGRISVLLKTRTASRVAFELFRGPIPDGMTIDHLCRQRSCVNPDHLEAISNRENVQRAAHFRAGRHVDEIRRMQGSGATQASIAEELGVSQGFVSKVLGGKWKGYV